MEMVEHDMFKKLNYNLNMPTSLDIILQLLFLEDESKMTPDKAASIQNLVGQAMPIIYLCTLEYSISHCHTQTSIALASLIWVLYRSDTSNPIRVNS